MRALREIKADYAAALPSRFRRTRTRLGGRSDAHYAASTQFYDLREDARDMDRNDAVIGQLVDRAVINMIRDGLTLVPQTGDRALDEELRGRFAEWADDAHACDAAGRLTFSEMERLVKRHEIIDGDVFALPLDDGRVQIVEGDYVDSPQALGGDTVHGVKIDAFGRPLEYWFYRERQETRFVHLRRTTYAADYDRKPARDESGEPVVLHIYSPQRVTQTRGVTAFHAVFDIAGMLEDVNFAKLVQQQVVSCVAAFVERAADFQFGTRTSETQDDATTQTLEELAPGLVIRGKPGEKLTSFTPNVPSNEYFEHVKLLLRMIGCNLGMPLTLVLLDTTNTTFHGYRGELQQARLGFEVAQRDLPRKFHRPIYRHQVRLWLPELGSTAARLAESGQLFRHKWTGRGWPYPDPKADAAKRSSERPGVEVSGRDVVNISTPAGVQGALQPIGQAAEPPDANDADEDRSEERRAGKGCRSRWSPH